MDWRGQWQGRVQGCGRGSDARGLAVSGRGASRAAEREDERRWIGEVGGRGASRAAEGGGTDARGLAVYSILYLYLYYI